MIKKNRAKLTTYFLISLSIFGFLALHVKNHTTIEVYDENSSYYKLYTEYNEKGYLTKKEIETLQELSKHALKSQLSNSNTTTDMTFEFIIIALNSILVFGLLVYNKDKVATFAVLIINIIGWMTL